MPDRGEVSRVVARDALDRWADSLSGQLVAAGELECGTPTKAEIRAARARANARGSQAKESPGVERGSQ